MVKFFLRLSLVCTILAATSTGTEERGLRLPDFEQGNSRAGFCFDLKLLIGFAGNLFFVFVVLAGSLTTRIDRVILVFLSLLSFLDLQESVEVRIPRYGWKCSSSNYKLASTFLLLGFLLVPISDYLLSGDMVTVLRARANPNTYP